MSPGFWPIVIGLPMVFLLQKCAVQDRDRLANFVEVHFMRLEQVLEQRAKDLQGWLDTQGGECWDEQKHLREGSIEQIYWHFGYLSALQDVLGQLAKNGDPPPRVIS